MGGKCQEQRMKVRCFSVSFADTRKVMRERPLSLLDTIEVREKKRGEGTESSPPGPRATC